MKEAYELGLANSNWTFDVPGRLNFTWGKKKQKNSGILLCEKPYSNGAILPLNIRLSRGQ
jgi:hypothetical protein